MLNPDSFQLISFDPGYVAYNSKNKTYFTLIDVSYRGTNAYGGVVPGHISGTVDFTVNWPSCTLSYKSSLFI